jgi:hypothetical protein
MDKGIDAALKNPGGIKKRAKMRANLPLGKKSLI